VTPLVEWLQARTGYRDAAHVMLDEPLPPGTGWFFTLGSVLLALLSFQLLSGAFLTLYYAATPDHAYDSVRYITSFGAGRIVRGIHHYGASFIIVASVAHLLRVVAFGSYKPPREVTWLSGLVLLGLILAFSLTGYLLPWDQRAYWATVVTINISKLTPVAGEIVAGVLRGGAAIGALTLTRWYGVHVIFLPAALGLLVVFHLVLMRRQGIS
jgi:ubiquinol-cytochrome c reductase cytochrome b subunit